ncbi:unnamed protein product [Penicillium bialowiezense]
MNGAAVRENLLIKIGTVQGGHVGGSAISSADARCQPHGKIKPDLRIWSLEFDRLMASIAMSLIGLTVLSDIVKVVIGRAD